MIFPKIQAFPTYWENGMKLTAEHFQHLENSIEDSIRDVRALAVESNEGYGLLPFSLFQIQNLQGELPNSVRIKLNACRAVLPGGSRVEIIPDNIQLLQLPSSNPFVDFVPMPGVRYHVFLIVGPKRVPAGIAQTRPIRYPYLVPEYFLECLPQEKLGNIQAVGPNRMKIAEWQNGNLIDGYIPAAVCIQGIVLLEKWHQYFQNQLETIAKLSIQITHEYRSRDAARVAFCQQILMFVRSSTGYYRYNLNTQSPFFLVSYFIDFVGLVEGLLESIDRDFIRNILKDGQINGLRSSGQELLKMRTIPFEEMAFNFVLIQRFTESLILTLQNLMSFSAPQPRSGDNQRITNG